MLLSREELDETARVHPQVVEYVSQNPQPKVDESDPQGARARLAAAAKMLNEALGPAPPGLSESYHEISMRDGTMNKLKIQRPADGPAGPLVVLYFGGGFVAGDQDQLTFVGRVLVGLFGASVVLTNYRLGPEYKFPHAQLDAWDSTVWAAENATGPLLASDPSKGFVIGGVSAGGSIAAALSRKFQEEKIAHPITGQWLCVPSLMDAASCPEKYKSSYIAIEQNSDTPFLSKTSRDMMARAVQWDTTSDLRFAVLSKTPASGQPRTYTQVCGMDPLRDDGLIYDEILKEAGVQTKIDLYPGCPHAHMMMMRGYEVADRGSIDVVVGFGWLLGKGVARITAAKVMGLEVA